MIASDNVYNNNYDLTRINNGTREVIIKLVNIRVSSACKPIEL